MGVCKLVLIHIFIGKRKKMCKQILVIDFEATCCNQNSFPRDESEIIEIGAVIADKLSGEIISEFQKFIKPIYHPNLTDFCKQLTKISQEDIDVAPFMKEVLSDMQNWLNAYSVEAWGSWGGYDERQLKRECFAKKIINPLSHLSHVNLKKEFALVHDLEKQLGLGQALRFKKLRFSGTPHRGIDDAKNIARLVSDIFV